MFSKKDYITACRICQNKSIEPFFDLGLHPLANSLIKNLKRKEKFYPLCLCWCGKCNVIQLNFTVDPKILFAKYFWLTGTSQGAKDFSSKFRDKLVAKTLNPRKNYVLEIASNDGTFLKSFTDAGYKVLGVDSAKNIVEIANIEGIKTVCGFWGNKFAQKIKTKNGQAQMIFNRNVLAHVKNIGDFVAGMKNCLSDDGTVASEVHYAGKILNGLQYDSIYHEHLFYFTLKPLEYLFESSGLYVFDAESSPISGGAIIVYAAKQKREISPRLKRWRDYESKNKVNDLETWRKFAKNSTLHKEAAVNLINKIISKEKNIVGWGASARSSTLLNFCKIDSRIIPIIADQNNLKHKHFTAGSHIPISSPELVMKRNPKFVIILAWNFTKEIMGILKNKFNYSGGYIIPLPNKLKIYK